MDIREIYDHYAPRVRTFIKALVRDEWATEDLIQETFLKIQLNLKELKDPTKILPWLIQIAHNVCIDFFRRQKREGHGKNGLQEALELPALENALAMLEQNRMSSCVQDKMKYLPESLRIVLILSDLMEFSHQEIAQVLGTTVQNVKVRLHRARKKFKDILEAHCHFEKDERNVLICTPVFPDGKDR